MAGLKKGDQAPGFTFTDTNGVERKLNDFLGKKVALYFYPKDNTPGCTAEACSLRDHYDDFLVKGIEVIGVSADSEKSHQGFRKKHDLPFHLISDPERKVIEAYGVWGEKKMMGRTYMGIMRHTFLIDESGRIEAVIVKVETANHAQQILKELNF